MPKEDLDPEARPSALSWLRALVASHETADGVLFDSPACEGLRPSGPG